MLKNGQFVYFFITKNKKLSSTIFNYIMLVKVNLYEIKLNKK